MEPRPWYTTNKSVQSYDEHSTATPAANRWLDAGFRQSLRFDGTFGAPCLSRRCVPSPWPDELGRAWGRTLALFELLFQELLPHAAVCRGPLVPGHASAALLLLLPSRRRSLLVARAIRTTSFVIDLRGARQGPQAGGIRRLACTTQCVAWGPGSASPAYGRSMRNHGGRARRATATRSTHSWRPASQRREARTRYLSPEGVPSAPRATTSPEFPTPLWGEGGKSTIQQRGGHTSSI